MHTPRPAVLSYSVRAALLFGAAGCSATPRTDAPAAASVNVTTSASTTVSAPALSAAPVVPRACLPANMERAEIASASFSSNGTLAVCFTSESVGHASVGSGSLKVRSTGPVTVDLDESATPTIPVRCLSVDLTSKKITADPTTQGTIQDTTRVKHRTWVMGTTDTDLVFCRFPFKDDTKCKRLSVPRSHPVEGGHGGETSRRLIASLSDDDKRAAVLLVERGSVSGTWSVKVDTYDRTSHRRLTRTPMSLLPIEDPRVVFFDASDFWSATWQGEWLELRSQRCCGPDGRSVLLDPATGGIEPLGDPMVAREVKRGVLLFDTPGEPFTEDGAPLALTLLHMSDRRRTVVPLPATRLGAQGRGVEVMPWKGSQWVVVHTFPPAVAWLDVEREAVVDQLRLPLCE